MCLLLLALITPRLLLFLSILLLFKQLIRFTQAAFVLLLLFAVAGSRPPPAPSIVAKKASNSPTYIVHLLSAEQRISINFNLSLCGKNIFRLNQLALLIELHRNRATLTGQPGYQNSCIKI